MKKYILKFDKSMKPIGSEYGMIVTDEKYRVIPNGFYKVQLQDIFEGEGKYGKRFAFCFEIIGIGSKDDSTQGHKSLIGCMVNDFVSKSMAYNGKLWRIVRTLTNLQYEEGKTVNLSKLIEKQCYVDIKISKTKNHVNKIAEYYSEDEYESAKTAA